MSDLKEEIRKAIADPVEADKWKIVKVKRLVGMCTECGHVEEAKE